jgi:hypothetical protein
VHPNDPEHRKQVFALAGVIDRTPTPATRGRVVETYDYTDEHGAVLYRAKRIEPGPDGKRKSFVQERPDGNNGWIPNMQRVRRVLYNLPTVLKSPEVFVVEGERKADQLTRLGFVATCNVGGAGKWLPEYTTTLRGKDVVLCPDSDEPGQRHLRLLVDALRGVAGRLRVVRVPAPHNDIVDLFRTLPDDKAKCEAVFAMLERAEEVTRTPPTESIQSTSETITTHTDAELNTTGTAEPTAEDAGTVLVAPMPQVAPILDGICEPGDLGDLISGSKDKKTWFAMALSHHLAAGRDFHGIHIARAVKVLYVNAEVRQKHFQRRQHMVCTAYGIPADAVKGRFFTIHGRAMSGEDMLAAIPRLAALHGVEFVVLDCLYRLLPPGADENLARDLGPVMGRLLRMAEETAAAFWVVHHDPKTATTGDRRLQDRGAGSSVASRANDFRVVLTRSRDDADAIVVEVLPRNFPAFTPFCIRFENGGFVDAGDVAPIAQTASDRAREAARVNREPLESKTDEVLALLAPGPMDGARFRAKVQRIAGTQARMRELVSILEGAGTISAFRERGRGVNRVTYGTPEQIRRLKEPNLAL